MHLFRLRERLVGDYGTYLRSLIKIRDEPIRARGQEELDAGLLWPQPLIQVNRRLKGITADGTEGYAAVRLEPVDPGYPVLVLQQTSDDDVRVVAEFVEVIEQ